MRIVIAKLTDSVFVDGVSFLDLKLGLPEHVSALYWNDGSGWIEYDNADDLMIDFLPAWTNECLKKWQQVCDQQQQHS